MFAPSERFSIPGAEDGVPASPDRTRDVAGPVGGSGVRTMIVSGMPVNSITAVGSGSAALRRPFTDVIEAAEVRAAGPLKTTASIKAALAPVV